MAPESVAGLVRALPPGGRVIVEDPYGAPPAVVPGTTVLRMPVMNRAPADVEESPRPDTTVGAVSDTAALAEAERVMVDGFPFPHLQPWQAGQALPARVLQLPGWKVWLARRGGVPAAACYTYDDGTAVGDVVHPRLLRAATAGHAAYSEPTESSPAADNLPGNSGVITAH